MYQRPRAKRRYLGMTVNQLLILAGLVMMICCVFVGGYAFLQYLVTTKYAPADPGLVTLPTPLPSATPGPTEPPTQTPTPTAIPYESLIPQGWKQFTSADAPGMEFWLPSGYKVLTGKDKDKNSPVPLYGPNVDEMKAVMVMADTQSSTLLLHTNAFVTLLPMRGSTLNEAVDIVFGQLLRTGQLIERKDFPLLGFAAQKLTIDLNANGVDAALVVYIFQRDQELWQFGFLTPYNELFDRNADFDLAAGTFRLLPVTPTPTVTTTFTITPTLTRTPKLPKPTNTPLP
jgi:hypothetical protein